MIIGVDEVGRGSIAGPVCVCAVGVQDELLDIVYKRIEGIKDSKKLTSKKREEWFNKILSIEKLVYGFSCVSNGVIDKRGIAEALKLAVSRSLSKVKAVKKDKLVFDYGLYASKEFINQKSFIKGDERIKIISMASVVAKVLRDKKMIEFHSIFPEYNFFKNKGYGTKEHIDAIKKRGECKLHRKSFL